MTRRTERQRRLVDVAFRKRRGRLPTVLERLACVVSDELDGVVDVTMLGMKNDGSADVSTHGGEVRYH